MSALSKQVNVRLSETEARDYQRAASERGLSLSEYVRACMEEQAAKVCPKCKGTGRVRR